jgi:Putative transposase
VFTLPQEVAAVALVNPVTVYNLLFQAACDTLQEVAANPKYLGAVVGLLLVLHTWGQNLHHHPHVHGMVTGGGLSCDARGRVEVQPRWLSCRPGFFLPVRVLSRVYRGKFLALLRQSWATGHLRWDDWPDERAFACWAAPLYAKDWVVYAKEPFGGPEQVLKYLARYTHRVAIGNSRLLEFSDGVVAFRYKDYRQEQYQRILRLPAVEFLWRWVQHVLPRGFVKIRQYGLWSNREREPRPALCRRLLQERPVLATTAPFSQAGPEVQQTPARGCPCCGTLRWVRQGEIPRQRPSYVAAAADTS